MHKGSGPWWRRTTQGATPEGRRGRPAGRNPAGLPATDPVLCEKYRQLTRNHLERLPSLFQDLTGLHCSVSWAPAWPHRWSERDLPTHSSLCRHLIGASEARRERCRACAMRRLALTLRSDHQGHRFTCLMGVHNFWQPIIVRGCTVGLAFVQALDRGAANSPRLQGARRNTPRQFDQAIRLLQLIFRHAETSTLADLRKSDLTTAQRALVELQTVTRRLREELNGLAPALARTPPVLQPESHPEKIVHCLLDSIEHDYSKPMTLADCASRLRMNPAYISALFSRLVGLPFKTYLTAVRIEKARQLLGDPAQSISEVASAVGYAGENRFRAVFRKVTGLSPRSWRETFCALQLVFLGLFVEETEFLEAVEGLLF